jgi:hypothetical protein
MILKEMNLYVFRIHERDDINAESKGAVAISVGRKVIGRLVRCGCS